MNEPEDTPNFTLPQTVLGRCLLGAISTVLFPLSLFICIASMLVPPEPHNLGELVWEIAFRIAVEAASLAMLVFSIFGMVWSIARPAWVEVVFQRSCRELAVAFVLSLVCVGIAPIIFWMFL